MGGEILMAITKSFANKIIALALVCVLLLSSVLSVIFADEATWNLGFIRDLPVNFFGGSGGQHSLLLPNIGLIDDNVVVHNITCKELVNFVSNDNIIQTGEANAVHLALGGANITIAPNSTVELITPNLCEALFDVDLFLQQGDMFIDVYRPFVEYETFRVSTPLALVDILGTAVHISHHHNVSEVGLVKGTIELVCLNSREVVSYSLLPHEGGALFRIMNNVAVSESLELKLQHIPALLIATSIPDGIGAAVDVDKALYVIINRFISQNPDVPLTQELFANNNSSQFFDTDINQPEASDYDYSLSLSDFEDTLYSSVENDSDTLDINNIVLPFEIPLLTIYDEGYPEYIDLPTVDAVEPAQENVTAPTTSQGGGSGSNNDASQYAPTSPETVHPTEPSTTDPGFGVNTPDDPVTDMPTDCPTDVPTCDLPTDTPTCDLPTDYPTDTPTCDLPTDYPTDTPTCDLPTDYPTDIPTCDLPTDYPTDTPTCDLPTDYPTDTSTCDLPTDCPTDTPTCDLPTDYPTDTPTCDLPTCQYGVCCDEPTDDLPTSGGVLMPSNEFQFELVTVWDYLGIFNYDIVIRNVGNNVVYEWEVFFNITPHTSVITLAVGADMRRRGNGITLRGNTTLGVGDAVTISLHGIRPIAIIPFSVSNVSIFALNYSLYDPSQHSDGDSSALHTFTPPSDIVYNEPPSENVRDEDVTIDEGLTTDNGTESDSNNGYLPDDNDAPSYNEGFDNGTDIQAKEPELMPDDEIFYTNKEPEEDE